MRYKAGKMRMKTADVIKFTGLSIGQVNAARRRGDLNEYQTTDGGDCWYDPEEVLKIQDSLWRTGTIGDSKLRKKPLIKNAHQYKRLVRDLQRCGYELNDLELVESPIKGGYELMSTDEAERLRESRMKADTLPFNFKLGSEEVPTYNYAAEDFDLLDCFGYADETNEECSENCKFFKTCCFARLRIMEAIAKGLDEGEDASQITAREKRVRASEIERVREQL